MTPVSLAVLAAGALALIALGVVLYVAAGADEEEV